MLTGASSGGRGFCLRRSEVMKKRGKGLSAALFPWQQGVEACSSLSCSNWLISSSLCTLMLTSEVKRG